MLEFLHFIGSSIRRAPLLKNQAWFWNAIEPGWQSVFRQASKQNGFLTPINEDSFYLTYEVGARYARADQRRYEPDFYLPFVREIKPGMAVLDVGAHVGIFSLGAALHAGPTGKVYAFEPAPETFAVLQKHIALNTWNNRIMAVRAMVTDYDGAGEFYTYGTSMAASMSQANVEVLNPEQRDRPASKIEATAITLDRFCAAQGIVPNVLKIDIEGAELHALRGARKLLEQHPITVFCEVHPQQMNNCGASMDDFVALIRDLGLELTPLDKPNPLGIFHSKLRKTQ